MNNEFICMKGSFYSKREARRIKIQNDAAMMDIVIKEKADDLDSQYERVFSIEGKTAKIKISGPLSPGGPDWIDVHLGYGGTAYENIIRAANEAKQLHDDGMIENVIVKMNTPGGTIDQLDQAHQALKTISEIGVVSNEGMIASAGVWLASAFNTILPATDSAQIGSIGVVYVAVDYSGWYDNFGIKEIEITNSESQNKRPDLMTDEGIQVVKKELDELYNVFISKVTATRPITADQINNLNGEMVIAERAVSIGLMDSLQKENTATKADDSDNVDDEENNEKENEMEKNSETSVDETPTDETPVANLALDERSRLIGLATVAGVDLSVDLQDAIKTGLSVGDFALKIAADKKATNKAEVDAAKELREKNKDQKINIDGSQHGQDKSGKDPLDKMLDKKFKTKAVK